MRMRYAGGPYAHVYACSHADATLRMSGLNIGNLGVERLFLGNKRSISNILFLGEQCDRIGC